MFIKLNTIKKVKDFVKEISDINADVDLTLGKYTIDAKSELGIFSLDLSKELKIKIISEDSEEINKFEEIVKKYGV